LIQDQERSTAGLSAVTLFNLYTDHIMRNVQLDESQAGIKIGRRNINHPKYADQLSSVTQSCPNLCDPMDCNTPGFPVYYQIMELARKLMSIESRCHPTISSSVIPFSFCLQSFNAPIFLVMLYPLSPCYLLLSPPKVYVTKSWFQALISKKTKPR